MKGPLKLTEEETTAITKDGRSFWLTPSGKLKRIDGNRWAFELVRKSRLAEADEARG